MATVSLQPMLRDASLRDAPQHEAEENCKTSSHWQAGVVLRKRCHRRLRAGHVIDLGDLALAVEIHLVTVTVQHLCHPPRETLPFPDPAEAGRRIRLQQILAAGFDLRLDGA